MNLDISKKKLIIPFLLGLLVSQNVIYLFKISNTYINITYVFAIIVLLYNIICHPNKIKEVYKIIDKKIVILMFLFIFSVFQYGITVIHIAPGIKSSAFWTGLILYGMALSVYLCVFLYKEHYSIIIKGLKYGLFINIIVCIVSYIAFNKGSFFSLYTLFPQEPFFVSIKWENRHLLWANNYLIYFYRASGLFLEASHFIAFLSCTVLILLKGNKKNDLIFKMLLIVLLFLVLISNSGTIVSIVFACSLYIILLMLSKKTRKISRNTLVRIILVFFLVTIGILLLLLNDNISSIIYKYINESLISANLGDSSNSTRLLYMKNALKCIITYPWGIGLNMAPTLLNVLYGTPTTFNYIFTVALELGPIGLIAYIWLFLGNILELWKLKKNNFDIALITSLFTILLIQIFDGISFVNPYIVLIIALCQLRIIEIKGEKYEKV